MEGRDIRIDTRWYGNDQSDNFRRTAAYVDRILKGSRPAELPVEQIVAAATVS
jgi:hypothetical protein